MRNKRKEYHDFYCIQCGKKGIPLPRTDGFRREKFHRKKLYCIFCKEEVNHIECSSEEDVFIFRESFEKGEFVNECNESLSFVRSQCVSY